MTRGLPEPGSRDLRTCRNAFLAFCLPYVHIAPDQGRGFLDVVVSERPRIANRSVPSSIKNYHWIDFELGLLEAYDRGGNTVVLTDGNGGISEGPGFNIFVYRGHELATPAENMLDGITRRAVMELAQELQLTVQARRVTPDELEGADEVFATSTAGGIMAVRSVNGRVLPSAPGPITRELARLYWERRENGWRGTPVDTNMQVETVT
jgi:branched-chain amino acid aminotransferase